MVNIPVKSEEQLQVEHILVGNSGMGVTKDKAASSYLQAWTNQRQLLSPKLIHLQALLIFKLSQYSTRLLISGSKCSMIN